MLPMNKQFGCTTVEAHQITYEWKIDNFKLLPDEGCIFSSVFRAKENPRIAWRLQLFPKDGKKDNDDQVSLYLDLFARNAEHKKIKVNCKVSILKSDTIKFSSSFEYTYETPRNFGFPKMMERSKLVNSSDSDDTVIIRCELDITVRTITKPVNPMSFDSEKGRLNGHFSALLGDVRLSDVTIIVGRKKFTAHKVVLAARSTVFSAMFEHKAMEENRQNEVKIRDLDAATVQGMLEFLYTDKVADLEVLARGLLRASDKYDLHRLRWMCEEVLYKNLTTDNAAEILVLSDLYHSCKLKEYVMVFIEGHLPSVVQSESYKSMVTEYPELLNELMCSMAARCQQKT